MGAVITFPELRRARREPAAREHGVRAAVIILPVIRIERGSGARARADAAVQVPAGPQAPQARVANMSTLVLAPLSERDLV